MCNAVNRLFQRLTYCNNRELLYDLYSYVWDMRGVVSLLNSYVKWLGKLHSFYMINRFYKKNEENAVNDVENCTEII